LFNGTAARQPHLTSKIARQVSRLSTQGEAMNRKNPSSLSLVKNESTSLPYAVNSWLWSRNIASVIAASGFTRLHGQTPPAEASYSNWYVSIPPD
jgi:hypothetical protein